MGAAPSRTGLLRLLLGAAFLLFGFFLASTTSAHADDSGLLGTGDAVTTVEQVVDSTVDVVDSAPARSAVPEPDTDVVTAPVDAVEDVVAEPAKVVDEPVRTVSETVVKPVVKPVVKAAVEPVVKAAVEPVVAPVTAVLPPVIGEIDPVVSPVNPVVTVVDAVTEMPAASDAAAPLVEVGDNAAKPTVAQAFVGLGQLGPVGHAADAAPFAVALHAGNPWTLSLGDLTLTAASTVVASGATDRAPSIPAPRPAGPQPGAVPGSGSSVTSVPGGADVATTSGALSLPEGSSAAPTSSTSRFTSGPATEPGSRPD
ncbi:hypothetical protein ACOCJ4_08435 [Knoellia sp. CPCC 206435]|uniref:hypothetical protein n=1 Tax=Knoellia terrae TaxID=3404797 RepID=UPI003B43D4E9